MNNKEIDMASFCYHLSKQSEDVRNALIFLGIPATFACYYVINLLKSKLKNKGVDINV